MIARVISGGQTGADMAALRAAKACGIPTGGYAPRGFLTEDGPDPSLADYGLVEMPTADYAARTRKNVEEADAALILMPHYGRLTGGSGLTDRECFRLGKPRYAPNIRFERDRDDAVSWLRSIKPQVLLVAGPRESKHPGIGALAERFLLDVLARLGEEVVQ